VRREFIKISDLVAARMGKISSFGNNSLTPDAGV
jgi:hypothetical protein